MNIDRMTDRQYKLYRRLCEFRDCLSSAIANNVPDAVSYWRKAVEEKEREFNQAMEVQR